MSPLVTLTTDFGTLDPYVGVMKGVILRLCPGATLVDITHEIRPQAVLQGAFLLGHSWRYFPKGTVHLAVVDPGVGTQRRAVVLQSPSALFVGPDNGLFSYVLLEGHGGHVPHRQGKAPLPTGFRAFQIAEPSLWLHPVSRTFHGRDIFAPVSAHLARGLDPTAVGPPLDELVYIDVAPPTWEGDTLQGRVVHVDRFGNLITDIPSSLLTGSETVEVMGRRIHGLSPSYQEGGELLAIVGSYDTLEIAVNRGNASRALGADVGTPVTLRR